MRPGELTGLTWGNVDLRENTIAITHALQRGPDGLRLGKLKNEWSGGVLPMPRNTRAALKAFQRQQAAERLQLGPHYGDLGSVFCQPDGAPVSRQLIHKMFKDVTEKAGLGRNWQPGETRHTTVSLLDDAGQPIEDISALIRHKNSQLTKVT
jgi:integrase